jgi:hypothetical protein
MSIPISAELAKSIYRILISECGASPDKELGFVSAFSSDLTTPREWRFAEGKLGFGGKYRHPSMRVDCYPEDSTSEREEIISRTNDKLMHLANNN